MTSIKGVTAPASGVPTDQTAAPNEHTITLEPDPGRFNRYRTTCSCGWGWRPARFEAICRAAAGDRHVEAKARKAGVTR
jgi:hypothetical protein